MKENTHFWHIMLYYFKKGKSAAAMQSKICAALAGVAQWIEH